MKRSKTQRKNRNPEFMKTNPHYSPANAKRYQRTLDILKDPKYDELDICLHDYDVKRKIISEGAGNRYADSLVHFLTGKPIDGDPGGSYDAYFHKTKKLGGEPIENRGDYYPQNTRFVKVPYNTVRQELEKAISDNMARALIKPNHQKIKLTFETYESLSKEKKLRIIQLGHLATRGYTHPDDEGRLYGPLQITGQQKGYVEYVSVSSLKGKLKTFANDIVKRMIDQLDPEPNDFRLGELIISEKLEIGVMIFQVGDDILGGKVHIRKKGRHESSPARDMGSESWSAESFYDHDLTPLKTSSTLEHDGY